MAHCAHQHARAYASSAIQAPACAPPSFSFLAHSLIASESRFFKDQGVQVMLARHPARRWQTLVPPPAHHPSHASAQRLSSAQLLPRMGQPHSPCQPRARQRARPRPRPGLPRRPGWSRQRHAGSAIALPGGGNGGGAAASVCAAGCGALASGAAGAGASAAAGARPALPDAGCAPLPTAADDGPRASPRAAAGPALPCAGCGPLPTAAASGPGARAAAGAGGACAGGACAAAGSTSIGLAACW